ncbi:hypothetical protein L3073_17245 [Ancylomarina sp. DW003]|nr:hypothetical protein [Ancylomarina sp. DW003]MDE5423963.1 hypothetical protein [Ancylomarina sp. DW003]
MIKLTNIIITIAIIFSSCSKDKNSTELAPISKGNDPNFTIVANTDKGLNKFNRKVVVFGVDIYAASGVEDNKLLHAANVMAQYLDNDEDGSVDNQLVIDKMLENKAFLYMWKTENDHLSTQPSGRSGQDLGADETVPAWHTNGQTGRFDASLEEIWHIINLAGHASAYPNAFGMEHGTKLADAMDIARGGYFKTIPATYPANAWYTYDDKTCGYSDCQTIEYLYWSMSSILGAQKSRLSEISNEWRLNTVDLVKNTDTAIYELLTDPRYKFPTVLPDGTYKR